MPTEQLLTEMGKYNEELVKAGVMLAGEGLQPSSKGARVKFAGGKRTVVDGPFAETKELVAGFWIIQVEVEGGGDRVGRSARPTRCSAARRIEIRQIFEAEDFGDRVDARAARGRERAARTGRRPARRAEPP